MRSDLKAKILLRLHVTGLSKRYLLVENLKQFSGRVECSKIFASASRALSFCSTDISYKMDYVDPSKIEEGKLEVAKNLAYGKHTGGIYLPTLFFT